MKRCERPQKMLIWTMESTSAQIILIRVDVGVRKFHHSITEFPGTLLKRIHRMNQNIERDGIFVKIKEHNEMNTTMKWNIQLNKETLCEPITSTSFRKCFWFRVLCCIFNDYTYFPEHHECSCSLLCKLYTQSMQISIVTFIAIIVVIVVA